MRAPLHTYTTVHANKYVCIADFPCVYKDTCMNGRERCIEKARGCRGSTLNGMHSVRGEGWVTEGGYTHSMFSPSSPLSTKYAEQAAGGSERASGKEKKLVIVVHTKNERAMRGCVATLKRFEFTRERPFRECVQIHRVVYLTINDIERVSFDRF